MDKNYRLPIHRTEESSETDSGVILSKFVSAPLTLSYLVDSEPHRKHYMT
jgi:hypothetical protein